MFLVQTNHEYRLYTELERILFEISKPKSDEFYIFRNQVRDIIKVDISITLDGSVPFNFQSLKCLGKASFQMNFYFNN